MQGSVHAEEYTYFYKSDFVLNISGKFAPFIDV